MATPAAEHTARNAILNAEAMAGVNAIDLLQADHRQVQAWCDEFQCTTDAARRHQLVTDICVTLEVHMRVEEEIFYPAFLQATGNESLHDEAIVEHEGARELIRKVVVCAGVPVDHYLPARVAVLAGLIQHRVSEEEKPGGLFEVAMVSGMDLAAIGARIKQRKFALMDSL